MNNGKCKFVALAAGALFFLGGCTAHPAGEREERRAALAAGKLYENSPSRPLPPLSEHSTPDDFVRYAMASNADIEQQYWQWRAAIEQVPIDGTQATNLSISLATTLNNGAFALDRTVATAGNDPMTDIVFPAKLSTAARRSLENARAAGVRFRKAQFELRRKILSAYDDYALTAELIRLTENNIQLLQTTATITAARQRSGIGGEADVLKASNDLDLARNDLADMRFQLSIEQAALNALLDRPALMPIPIPQALPSARAIAASDQALLDRAARMNPELLALADEIRARHEDIRLAKLQYVPDFDLSASTDLKGMAQTLLGQFTIPLVRYDALRAGVAQAEANLKAAEAMRRQNRNDLSAQIISDIYSLRDADRQLELLSHTILPRARQAVTLGRTAYETGNASLLDLLDSQRSLIEIERLSASLEATRDKVLAELESIEEGRIDCWGL
jgi:outer membrane protein TolC